MVPRSSARLSRKQLDTASMSGPRMAAWRTSHGGERPEAEGEPGEEEEEEEEGVEGGRMGNPERRERWAKRSETNEGGMLRREGFARSRAATLGGVGEV